MKIPERIGWGAYFRQHLPHPRAVDFTLLGAVLVSLVTGVVSLFARPGDAWLVVLNGLAGVLLTCFVCSLHQF